MRNFRFFLRVTGALAPLFCAPARANDSAFSGVSGTPKPMRGEHASIAMQSEKIVIVADDKGYSTDVDFTFRNDGAATQVQMGFPESSYGDTPAAHKSAFLRFTSMIDGQKAATRRIVVQMSEETTEAYWVKTVAFARHQTRRVRVSYRSRWGGNVEWGTHQALIYDFTGQNWKGQVERSDLEIRVATPGLYTALPLFGEAPLPMQLDISPMRAVFRKTWRNWQAQGSFTFGLTRAVPFWMQDRALLTNQSIKAPKFNNTVTFRVGAVPDALPDDAEAPPAFTRNGVNYLSLSYLRYRLQNETSGGQLTWNPRTKIAKLQIGAKTLSFSPATPPAKGVLPAIPLGKSLDTTLYVPAESLVKTFGFKFSADPENRLFDLKTGAPPKQ